MNNEKQARFVTHQTASVTSEMVEATHQTYTVTKTVKQSVQELLKFGLLYSDEKPQLYRYACAEASAINRILSALDLFLVLDEVRGLAFLRVADPEAISPAPSNDTGDHEDAWSHPLVRRQRLNLEQSLLLAVLRQYYVVHEQNLGIGVAPAVMDVDDVQTQLSLYLGESGSDAKDEKRTRNLLDHLKTHGIVSEINDQAQFTIRPIISHVASPTTLAAQLQQFRQLANQDQGSV